MNLIPFVLLFILMLLTLIALITPRFRKVGIVLCYIIGAAFCAVSLTFLPAGSWKIIGIIGLINGILIIAVTTVILIATRKRNSK